RRAEQRRFVDADARRRVLQAKLSCEARLRRTRPEHEAGIGEQVRVVHDLVTLDVAGEEIVRECGVASDRSEYRLRVRNRVRTIDVAGCAPARLAEARPQRAHEVVERDLPDGSLA